ncbi:hypothetical protein HWB76_gp046 [Streptomyces phage Blueeyedbeauty]|uniref:Uncharacterized protein n=1 Tax=Streptomyces phage Blueeyedbeauty TaxID=2250336 RepID=A0A345L252_9CAUD|nr:hypothetical protein HWB76_gp046 [Streptomyces phage Blueeyedbeauty]AXH49354.1 hypothetical protein SEA_BLUEEYEDBEAUTY_247 [Streptomyces phage Blueeyedbeauty]
MMMIPAPRVEVEFPCTEKGCDGFYVPYSDGLMVCYDGHVSSLSVDDVELPVGALVPVLEEC